MRTRLPRAYARNAGWARDLAAFALALGVAAVVWRRWGLIDLDGFGMAVGAMLGLAGLAVLLAVVATIQIVLSDAKGMRDAIIAIVLAGLVVLPIGLAAAVAAALPEVNIVTTSVDMLKAERRLLRTGEGVKVGGADLAAYPDVLPLVVERPSEDVFATVEEIVAQRGWRVLEHRPPAPGDPSGRLRTVVTTPILGFRDDVVVAVDETDGVTRVEALSASRIGRHDLGANARRLSALLADIDLQVGR